ncbi:R3H domain-containing protein 2 [Colletotrichum chlorophyti]|uniref:R3H domain-containing protein 2 n=1 Tax=Colletotrichum chlorophyti TaxID=708187 RepID=A0A1Q8RCY7_9PEZI|nr:R3H domain-containing protein 2 [Colletotrichum chlorophyti]
MATAQMSPDIPKPSFAKVAASASKDNPSVTTVRRVAAPAQDQPTPGGVAPLVANGAGGRPSASESPAGPQHESTSPEKPDATDAVVDGLKDLNVGGPPPSLVVNGTGSTFPERSKSAPKDASDDSQRADSSSELGTKPPSLDGKSITSGTTFALDEKESLRPDDSASVKASAAEDDDMFSFRGPNLPSSRMGSDIAARARGIIQLGDMPDRRIVQPTSGSLSQGMITPQSASSDQPPIPSANALSANLPDSANLLNTIYGQAPDEKLLEAMASPKDRLFLLRLESELIKFVQNSKEPYMDFPPSNSFCRMLTHKLADYYRMTHQYESRIGSVRIFRTPYARVPESLASIAAPETNAETPPPPAVLPRKIMRRGEDGELATASASPSKPTSETGSDSKDKSAAANQKLSREQREEAYKQARERIFGNSEKTGESTPGRSIELRSSPPPVRPLTARLDNEGENGVSRASSVSARDKTNTKRGKTGKQRRDDSDSFDSRHNYTPYWGPQQQTWMPQPQYVPVSNQYGAPVQQPYPSQVQAPYNTTPTQSFAPVMPTMGYNAPYPPPQANQPQFQSPQRGYGGAGPAPAPPPPQAWQQGFGQAPAPTPPAGVNVAYNTPRGMSAPPGQGSVPYMYGQLPANINPNDPKSQHPIPGSYNRHAFNPKTQSFVPGGGMAPMQPPQPPFSAPGSHHGSPQIGSPHLAYAGYQQPGPPAPYGVVAGYGMARQGSNNSIPSYHHTPPQHPHHLNSLPQTAGSHIPPQHPQQHLPQHPSPHIPNKPAIPQGPAGQTFSHLPHYGNPATLPQKPNMGI